MLLVKKIFNFLIAIILIIGIPFWVGYYFESPVSGDIGGLIVNSWIRGILYFVIPIIGGALLVMILKFIWYVVNDQQKIKE